MKNIGLIITTLSLISIVITDFKNRQVLNLSLVLLAIGLGIYLPGISLWVSFGSAVVAAFILIILNSILIKLNKAKIEAGDCKLILILSFFFKLEIFLGILLVSSIFGLILVHSKKKIPFGGILSSITLLLIINFL